jgi:hypothetical protein
MRNPIFRNIVTVLGIAGVVLLLGLAAKYGNKLLESILATGIQSVITIFVTALIVAVILGVVEVLANNRNNGKKGQHRNNDD